MDKYVVRTVRQKQRRRPASPPKTLKQTTIDSLKRVVIVEDIERAAFELSVENQKDEVIIAELDKLIESEKIPPKNLLLQSGLGRILNKLRKHGNTQISEKAQCLYVSWRTFFKNEIEKPQIEVQYGRQCEKLRISARSMINKALHNQDDKLGELIERQLFEDCLRKAEIPYKKLCRKIVFSLQNDTDLNRKVVEKLISAHELCKTFSINKK